MKTAFNVRETAFVCYFGPKFTFESCNFATFFVTLAAEFRPTSSLRSLRSPPRIQPNIFVSKIPRKSEHSAY